VYYVENTLLHHDEIGGMRCLLDITANCGVVQVNKTRLGKEKRKAAGARLLELDRSGADQQETAGREARQHHTGGDSDEGVALPWTMSIVQAGAKFYGVGPNRSYEMARLGLMPTVPIGDRRRRAVPRLIIKQLSEAQVTGALRQERRRRSVIEGK
jgi:hypothetical protein